MNIFFKHWFFAVALCAGFTNPLHAAINKYALLVGISEYHTSPLAGPVNDVRAMHSTLTKYWGFKDAHIDILLNRQATKSNILEHINLLYKKSHEGDEIFIYLSGHGTSYSDKNLSIPLPITTGAFIPYDVRNVRSMDELIDRLLIGNRDFRPLLDKLDNGERKVFVAIDACYSGNTVRGAFSQERLPTRFMRLSDLLPKREFIGELSLNNVLNMVEQTEQAHYPYENIFYLSASGEHEQAEDIPPNMIAKYPTIDSKPHGAFTDSLLRVLSNRQRADINKDGVVTYAELKKTLRGTMQKRGFNHTPQGLPSLAEDRNNLAARAIFGVIRKPDTASLSSKEKSVFKNNSRGLVLKNRPSAVEFAALKIRLDASLDFLAHSLKTEKQILVVKSGEDIFLSKNNGNIVLLSFSGDLIYTMEDGAIDELKMILKRHHWAGSVINRGFDQQFIVELEMFTSGRSSTAVEDQVVGFAIQSSEDAYFLLIDIDPSGIASVLFPYNNREVVKYFGMQKLLLKNISRVRAPFGRDSLLLYAFNKPIKEYYDLVGKQFTLGSPLMSSFERLINNNEIKKARAILNLTTAARTL